MLPLSLPFGGAANEYSPHTASPICLDTFALKHAWLSGELDVLHAEGGQISGHFGLALAVLDQHLSIEAVHGVGQGLELGHLFGGGLVDGHAVGLFPAGQDVLVAGAVELALLYAGLLAAVVNDLLELGERES